MSRDRKIDKINAYKKVIETKRLPKPPTESRDKNADDDILEEFTNWAEAQLAKLLGEGTDAQGFSDSEVELLKAFAQRLQGKIDKLDTAPARSPVQQVQPAPTRSNSKGTVTAEEEESDDDDKAKQVPISHRLKKPKTGANILDALDELDRRGPKF